jgi:leucyl aminopeptidase
VTLELPTPPRLAIVQAAALPRTVDAFDHIAVLLPASAASGAWPAFPHSKLLEGRFRARHQGEPDARLRSELEDGKGTRVAVAFVEPAATTFELLTLARKLVAEARESRPRKLALLVVGLDAPLAARAAEAYAAAALAAEHALPEQRSTPLRRVACESLAVHGAGTGFDLARLRATDAGNGLARWLATLPPNQLTPGAYRALVAKLAKRHGWTMRFHDERALAKRGAEAFLAVVRGSEERDAGIVELAYAPKRKAKGKGDSRPLALVGKGLCFDTGGSNLKSAKGMYGMHGDMGGSAVALGTLLALTELGAPLPVRCYLALAQNRIGPRSYLPNEVLRASNGVTIEVVHTDAEGRMVLADTLVLAGEARPAGIVDFATLTGSCVHALTDRMSGVFTNRPALDATLIEAGRASGERVWPFPMDADYDEALESKVADVKQCLIEGQGDHILAARFLSRFVPKDVPWVHVDLAAGDREGGLGHISSLFTGFGVRFALDLILDRRFGSETR